MITTSLEQQVLLGLNCWQLHAWLWVALMQSLLVCRRVDASTLLVVFANPDQAAAALHALSHQMTAKPYAQVRDSCWAPAHVRRGSEHSDAWTSSSQQQSWILHMPQSSCTPACWLSKPELDAQACKASKLMPAEDLQPPRPRPQTSAAVANRLIGHALNTRDTRNKASSARQPLNK